MNQILSTASVNVSIDCDTYTTQEIEFVCIKAGSFEMGSPFILKSTMIQVRDR